MYSTCNNVTDNSAIKIYAIEIHLKAFVMATCPPTKEDQDDPSSASKNVCKREIKALDMSVDRWDELVSYRSRWRQELGSALKRGEARRQ